MGRFRVWAPVPKSIELQLENRRLTMISDPEGWWSADIPAASPGNNYGYILDGEGPFPDPRSPWQPDGVHGLSRLIDHGTFPWTDGGWQAPPLSSAIIYELHIGTFTPAGTFEAAIEKLDHLVALGVTHVELMPVNEFSGTRGWGYDGVDLFAPHHSYGGPDGLKKLVNACHARRLAVLLDVVYNHLGPEGNYLGKFAPYFSTRHFVPWGAAMNFDSSDSDEVRRFFCDNALMWLRDYHFDGLRLDAVHAIFDSSAAHFLEQLSVEVEQLETELGRHLVLIAESDLNDPRLLWSRERGGFGLDAQWSDDFHHALHTILTGERGGYYADFGTLAAWRNPCDTPTFTMANIPLIAAVAMDARPPALTDRRFLGYLQNHDQIGNRAKGDRLSQLLSIDRLKIGVALVLASPFIPMIFQGEEWGAPTPFHYFTDHQDPNLARAVREGRRQEFAAFGRNPEEIPDPQAREIFAGSKLNWPEFSRPAHANLFDWYRQLIRLRRGTPALNDGDQSNLSAEYDEQSRWLLVKRGPISIACNLGDNPQPIPLRASSQQVLLASKPMMNPVGDHANLPPDSIVILKSIDG